MRNFKLIKSMLIIFIMVLFFAGGGFAIDRQTSAEAETNTETAETLSRTTMKVSNLSCGACLSHIDAEFKKVPEVKGMTGNLRMGAVIVDHVPSLKGEKIAAIITKLGYPAKVISEITIDEKDSISNTPARQQSSGCCGGGSSTGRGCGASSSSWKRLFGK